MWLPKFSLTGKIPNFHWGTLRKSGRSNASVDIGCIVGSAHKLYFWVSIAILYTVGKYYTQWKNIIHCGKILYALWENIIYCGKMWYTVVKYYTLWKNIIHCGKMLYTVGKYYTHCGKILYALWENIIRIVGKYYIMWKNITHSGKILYTVEKYYILWKNITHCGKILYTVEKYYTLWKNIIHCGKILYTVEIYYTHCGKMCWQFRNISSSCPYYDAYWRVNYNRCGKDLWSNPLLLWADQDILFWPSDLESPHFTQGVENLWSNPLFCEQIKVFSILTLKPPTTLRGLKLFDEENLPEPVSVEQVFYHGQSHQPEKTQTNENSQKQLSS